MMPKVGMRITPPISPASRLTVAHAPPPPPPPPPPPWYPSAWPSLCPPALPPPVPPALPSSSACQRRLLSSGPASAEPGRCCCCRRCCCCACCARCVRWNVGSCTNRKLSRPAIALQGGGVAGQGGCVSVRGRAGRQACRGRQRFGGRAAAAAPVRARLYEQDCRSTHCRRASRARCVPLRTKHTSARAPDHCHADEHKAPALDAQRRVRGGVSGVAAGMAAGGLL